MLRVFVIYTICAFYTIAFAERGMDRQKGVPKVPYNEVSRSHLHPLPIEIAIQ